MQQFKTPQTAMILAAGQGSRMLHLSRSTPKVLLPVGGIPLLEHLLTFLEEEGVTQTVINTFHLGEAIEAHCAQRSGTMTLAFSREEKLLDTGGGVKHALPTLGKNPFFVINGDILWKNQSSSSCLGALAQSWNPEVMDALLLLIPHENAFGHEGAGSFFRDTEGTVSWRGENPDAPYVFGGIQIVHPRAYDAITEEVFSNRLMWNRLLERNRLHSVVWDGTWYHLGTFQAYTKSQNFEYRQNLSPS